MTIKLGNIELVNLTPHPIKIQLSDGSLISIGSNSDPVRIEEEKVLVGMLDRIPIWRKKYTKVNYSLPKENGKYYIVSMPVAQALKRDDLLIVNDVIRDEEGNVMYARSLAMVD